MAASAVPGFETRVRESFSRQAFMQLLGAQLTRVESGVVEIAMPFRADLTQQHGSVHAGVVTALVDTACGYAALTQLGPDLAIVSVEYKINLLRPAVGESIWARGEVLRSGRTLTVCSGQVYSRSGEREVHVATMLATMMGVAPRSGRSD
jgi:uncharacterized protein (TIGR00369 family)